MNKVHADVKEWAMLW